jgi:hypothetical protein
MEKDEAPFLLYENRPNNKAVGHHRSCGDVKKNGGGDLITGRWTQFDSRKDVEDAGNKTGRPFWWCKRCGGLPKN